MENREDIPFEELLAALRDESVPVPPKYLYRLSDLAGEELDSMKQVWLQAGLDRRRRLVEDLETLEESYTLASFIELYKMAIVDDDPQVRVTGLRAVWDYEEPDLLPAILDRLQNDPADEVRAQAAAALGRFVYMAELDELTEKTAAAVVDALLAVMDGDSPEVIRRRALESLGYGSRESINDHIQDAYQYGDGQWVASALVAMGRSLDDHWNTAIMDKLNAEDTPILIEAVRAAGLLNLEDALPILTNLIEHEDEELRYAAVWALSEIGGEEARDTLDDLMAQAEDEEEIEFLDSAMENLFLNDEIKELSLMDFSEDDLEDISQSPDDELDE